jgi:hypothetical protein
VKDRIGNKLAKGDRVLVMLPEAQIFGFVADLEEGGLIAGLGPHGAPGTRPGRVLVSCVVALPVELEFDAVGALVKVVDPDKAELEAPERAN